jgi:hypothetical protein
MPPTLPQGWHVHGAPGSEGSSLRFPYNTQPLAGFWLLFQNFMLHATTLLDANIHD